MKPRYPRINPDRDRKRHFYLDEDVILTLESGQQFLIPRGYRFDGPSIPFPFKLFFRLFDVDIYAVLVHDYLIDIQPFCKLPKKVINDEFQRFIENPLYKATAFRTYIFPRATRFYSLFRYW